MTAFPALPAWGLVLLATVLSTAVAGAWWRHARERVLDLPDDRRLHQVPTARGGGLGIAVVRVPAYSPQAVAEHTVGMMLCLSRKFHKAYNRTRDNNFDLNIKINPALQPARSSFAVVRWP